MGFKEVIMKDGVQTGSVARTHGTRFWREVGDLKRDGYKVVLQLGKDGKTLDEVHLYKNKPQVTFKHVGDHINDANLAVSMPGGRERRMLYVE